jgi:peptidoglycan/xylan/chitin deacetylase (PgdA/CDA1 family)
MISLRERALAGAGLALRATFPERGLGRFCDRYSLAKGLPPLRRSRLPKFQILVYHRVLPGPDPFGMGVVTTVEFRAQMAALRRCFRVISLDALAAELERGGPEPGAVCVTFDDGYRDNLQHALPVLEEFGIPATVYLATDFIGTGKLPWYERVLDTVRRSRAPRLVLEGTEVDLQLGEGLARATAAHRLLGWLKQFDPAARDGHIDRVQAELGNPGPASGGLMLDWTEVKELARRGVAIGAHTQSHPILTTVPVETMEAEIAGSKREIEGRLDAPVTLFAYPNGKRGDFDGRVKDVVRRLGFTCAVTTVEGVNTSSQDRFELYRRQPWERSANSFLFRMCAERLSA